MLTRHQQPGSVQVPVLDGLSTLRQAARRRATALVRHGSTPRWRRPRMAVRTADDALAADDLTNAFLSVYERRWRRF